MLDGSLGKTKNYAIRIEVANISNRLYGFSLYQVLKMKLPILSLLRK